MDKNEIINYLKENNCDTVKEISFKNNILVLSFNYEFDDYEIEAAKSFAKDECMGEFQDDDYYLKYFLPYLHDIAADNVGDYIDDIIDDYDINAQYIGYSLNMDDYSKCEFTAVFSNAEIDIEDYLNELGINRE